MTRKSYGKMRGCRLKLRTGKKLSINRYMQEFQPGQKVHVSIVSSSPFQHPRFHGKTGVIKERRGNSYKVQVNDMNKAKLIFLRPEHLNVVR